MYVAALKLNELQLSRGDSRHTPSACLTPARVPFRIGLDMGKMVTEDLTFECKDNDYNHTFQIFRQKNV